MKNQILSQTQLNRRVQRAEQQIRRGWQVGVGSICYTLLAVMVNQFSSNVNLIYIQTPLEVVVITLLSWLIFNKNPFGAILMVVYFTAHKITLFYSGGYHPASTLIIDLVLLYFYIMAARGALLLRQPSQSRLA